MSKRKSCKFVGVQDSILTIINKEERLIKTITASEIRNANRQSDEDDEKEQRIHQRNKMLVNTNIKRSFAKEEKTIHDIKEESNEDDSVYFDDETDMSFNTQKTGSFAESCQNKNEMNEK